MQKLDFFGVGPKIGRVVVPWLIVTILASIFFKNFFKFFQDSQRILFFTGLALIIIGLIIYFSTIPSLLKGVKNNTLVTTGAFYFCCNPLYASIILFVIPGTAFMMNSWLVLSTSIAAYIVFRLYIKDEEKIMEEIFGQDYKNYRSATPGIFPLPLKKLFHKI